MFSNLLYVLQDAEQRFSRLIWLYYLSMDHAELYSCLQVLVTQVSGLRSPALCNLIRELHSRPRTLKQICRVAIHVALQRRPGLYINKLQLPAPLKEYILNFTP